MTEPDQYVLGYRQAEQERLQQQAQQLADESSRLFDRIGVANGARVVEFGCGPHGCLDLLSERVGPLGRVVGVERSFHEADYVSHVRDPPSAAWTRLVELLETYSDRNGIDPHIGRKVPRLLREAGLADVRVNPIVHVYAPGHGRRNLLLDLSRHLADADTLVVSHLYFQVWGRKPGS